MTEEKHTEGPWRVERINGGHAFGVYAQPDKTIAVIRGDQEPDARLIAAAPALKEALKRLRTQWARDPNLYGVELRKLLTEADAALRLAEGE